MSQEIRLNKAGYQTEVDFVQLAGQNIESEVEELEISAKMDTLERFVMDYSKLITLMGDYQELVLQDVKRLNDIKTNIETVDKNMIQLD